MSSTSEISSLLETLTASIEVFKAELVRQQLPEPSLRTSKPHPIDDPSYIPSPAMYEARRLAVGSLNCLKLIIENPAEAALSIHADIEEVQGLRVSTQVDLHQVLESAADPDSGESIETIAIKTKIHPLKLGAVLRFLAYRGWYREPRPGHFANSRRSHALKKDSPGYHVVHNLCDLGYKYTAKLPEALTHPDESFRMALDVTHTALNLAYDTDLPFFGAESWTSKYPADAQTFALGMGGMGAGSNNGVAYDFPWVDLAKDKDAVVDVGGGQGTLCCTLAAAHPELKNFIVQDIPALQGPADKYIASQGLSDRVKFEVQDFFQPNRRQGTGSYVFVIQKVLHDWSDEDGAKILRQIRECLLDGKSSLVIIDPVLSPATISSEAPSAKESLAALQGKDRYEPVQPPPLLPHDFGDNWMIAHTVNIALLGLCNAFERTYASMDNMLTLAGLSIKKMNATRGYVQLTEVAVS